MILPTAAQSNSWWLPCEFSSTATRSGVMNMPRMFEAEAEQIAAGTLPPATDVKAIEDCTVEGSTQRNRTPAASAGVSSVGLSRPAARPRIGKSTKVEANTTRCRRQCTRPASAVCRSMRAPCRKNSSAIMPLANRLSHSAALSCTGRTLPRIRAPTIIRVKLSGRRRESMAGRKGRGLTGSPSP